MISRSFRCRRWPVGVRLRCQPSSSLYAGINPRSSNSITRDRTAKMIHNAALRGCAIIAVRCCGAATRHIIGSMLCNGRVTQKVSGQRGKIIPDALPVPLTNRRPGGSGDLGPQPDRTCSGAPLSDEPGERRPRLGSIEAVVAPPSGGLGGAADFGRGVAEPIGSLISG